MTRVSAHEGDLLVVELLRVRSRNAAAYSIVAFDTDPSKERPKGRRSLLNGSVFIKLLIWIRYSVAEQGVMPFAVRLGDVIQVHNV